MGPRSSLAVLLIAAVTLTGCGFGQSAKKPPLQAPKAAPTTTIPTTSTTNIQADSLTASKIVLTASDVPSGWTDTGPAANDKASPANTPQLDQCAGVASNRPADETKVMGDEFTQGDNSIDSEVEVKTSPTQVRQDLAVQTNPRTYGCLENALKASLKQNDTYGLTDDTKSSLAPLPGITNTANEYAIRMGLTVTVAGQSASYYVDAFGIDTGRVEVECTLEFNGNPPPASLEKSLLSALEAHLRAARHTSSA